MNLVTLKKSITNKSTIVLVLFALGIALLAGILNGSYVLPVKYIKTWKSPNIWLLYSFFTFLLIPLFLFLIPFGFFDHISKIPTDIILILLGGGFLFGISTFLFSYGLRYIGMGVSFLLNIAGGTVFGSLIPVLILHKAYIFQPFGLIDILGLTIFVLGTILSSKAAKIRDSANSNVKISSKKGIVAKGILFSVLSGAIASGENISYTYALPYFKAIDGDVSHFLKVNYPWGIIFLGAFVSTFILFSRDLNKDKLWHLFKVKIGRINVLLTFMMSVLAFGSLLVYGFASLQLGDLGPVVAWPIFMITIVLTSNFWSFYSGEWKKSSRRAYKYQFWAILMFLIAIGVLAWDAQILISL